MAARGAWALQELEERAGLGRVVRSGAALVLAATLAPLLLFSYIVTWLGRTLWCRLLERRFPGTEPDLSPSVRAATDTRRNQGVVTLLLHARGRCDPDLIRAKVQSDLVDLRNSRGVLRFPRLRAALTSRWGHYAWRPSEHFTLDNHVVVGGQMFRGRLLTDANIQDYVSDIVSKGLPAELPPWQLVLMPLAPAPSAEPQFYVLLRLHHLLVDELAALREALAGDWGWGQPLVATPRALTRLALASVAAAEQAWRVLRETRDPLHNPEILEKPSLDHLGTVVVFVVADATREVLSKQPWYRVCAPSVWREALLSETKRRHVTARSFASQLRYALSPARLAGSCLRCLAVLGVLTVRAPLLLLSVSRSPVARRLTTEALRELAYWSRVALDGPRIVLSELCRAAGEHPPPLVSLCGRRVVAWSDPAPVHMVERIAEAAGTSPVEVLLAAACGALREHYRRQGSSAPAVPVQPLGASGVLLLPPTALPLATDEPLAALRAIARRFSYTRRQPALLLASAWLRRHLAHMLPSLSVRLLLNCVTRRYAAIIMTSAPLALRRGPAQLWGYTVDSVLLWRPPQANISVSLSLVRLGDGVRLAVMADQQLWPHHAALPTAFLAQLRETAAALGVPRSPRPSAEPGEGTASLRHEEEALED